MLLANKGVLMKATLYLFSVICLGISTLCHAMVVNTCTRKPVKDAVLEVSSPTAGVIFSTKTNSDGRFADSMNFKAGDTITVKHPRYQTAELKIKKSMNGKEVKRLLVRLTSVNSTKVSKSLQREGHEVVRIQGEVFDACNGHEIIGLDVYIDNLYNDQNNNTIKSTHVNGTITDFDGYYSFDLDPKNRLDVEADAHMITFEGPHTVYGVQQFNFPKVPERVGYTIKLRIDLAPVSSIVAR